ncbi:hypothetical protein OROGR_030343 [Orobanche gracilis]
MDIIDIPTVFSFLVKIVFAGVLVVLDGSPEGIIYQDLIPEYVNFARTLYEEDFGEVVVDINYLNVGAKVPKFQIFIC